MITRICYTENNKHEFIETVELVEFDVAEDGYLTLRRGGKVVGIFKPHTWNYIVSYESNIGSQSTQFIPRINP